MFGGYCISNLCKHTTMLAPPPPPPPPTYLGHVYAIMPHKPLCNSLYFYSFLSGIINICYLNSVELVNNSFFIFNIYVYIIFNIHLYININIYTYIFSPIISMLVI